MNHWLNSKTKKRFLFEIKYMSENKMCDCSINKTKIIGVCFTRKYYLGLSV